MAGSALVARRPSAPSAATVNVSCELACGAAVVYLADLRVAALQRHLEPGPQRDPVDGGRRMTAGASSRGMARIRTACLAASSRSRKNDRGIRRYRYVRAFPLGRDCPSGVPSVPLCWHDGVQALAPV